MSRTLLTNKSSKNEVLKAYGNLLGEVETSIGNNRAQKQERQRELSVVERAESNSMVDIIQQAANLKVSISQGLDELTNQLVIERDKLDGLQEAIKIETKKLEETYEILANANSLETLILAQKKKQEDFEKELLEKRIVFENEMFEKRKVWAYEQEIYEVKKRERERSEEEYEYQQKIKQQKDLDQYETRRATLERGLEEKKQNIEKSLHDREAVLSAQEEELSELREASRNFTEKLKTQIEEAKAMVAKELEKQYEI